MDNLEKQFKADAMTWITAVSEAIEAGQPVLAAIRTVTRWEAEVEAEMLEVARKDVRAVARAKLLAASNCGMNLDDARSVEQVFWDLVGGIKEGMIGGHDAYDDLEAEEKARNQAQAEVDAWVEVMAEYVGRSLPNHWSDIDALINRMESV